MATQNLTVISYSGALNVVDLIIAKKKEREVPAKYALCAHFFPNTQIFNTSGTMGKK